MRNDESDSTKRDAAGRYAHGLDALCRCGHAKGLHTAERPHECIAADFDSSMAKPCSCERFTKARAPRKARPSCADCGEPGKTTGHQECPFPQDHE